MGLSNYGGALKLKDINKPVTTPLSEYQPYFCPVEHTEWTATCHSCRALYGEQRRQYDE